MKLNPDPQLPLDPRNLAPKLTDLFRAIAQQVNSLTEGRMSGLQTAMTAAPTTGTWAKGDFVRNAEPVELGIALSKYIVFGFVCTDGGQPGTWVDVRTLTGN